jgi:PAS domain S-box-containing protein
VQAALQESERLHRLLAETITDVIWMLDAGLRVTYVSPAVTGLLGFEAARALGRPVSAVLTPPSLALALGVLAALPLGPESANATFARTLVLEHRRRDGGTVWAEVRASVRCDAEGRISDIVGSTRDISEQRATERQLRLQAAALTAAGNGIAITDAQGRVEWVNPGFTRLTGYSAEETRGRTLAFLGSGQQDQAFYRDLWDSVLAGRVWRGELVNRRRNGTLYHEEQSITPVRWGTAADSPVEHLVAIKRDISDRKAAEEAVRRSHEELQHFAYVVSHDLQEPLRMVASYVQLLARRYAGRLDADADDFIRYAVDGATRMQALINDLLAYSRVGAPLKAPAPCSMETVLRAAIDNLAVALADSGGRVTHDPLPIVVGDEVRLTTVLQNLIGNALKFRGEAPPAIHVSCRREERGWTLAVHDNGIGIDPRHFGRLFRMFQRLHTREEFPGTGAGLAICKRIVERHGGRIWVESEPGRGASFFVWIPEHPVATG